VSSFGYTDPKTRSYRKQRSNAVGFEIILAVLPVITLSRNIKYNYINNGSY
jgi:hypothetical protein